MAQQGQVGRVATTVAREGETTRVTYHSTVVVAFTNETVVLNSGDWFTPTTKTRMNQASHQFGLGYVVFQRDWHWWVAYKGRELSFYDGMELYRGE